MRYALIAVLAVGFGGSANSAQPQVQNTANEPYPKPIASWSDYRLTRQQLEADEQLKSIQRRIDAGELPRIQFAFNSAKIRPSSYPTLNVLADWLLKHQNEKLRIEAHTCNIGGARYNLDLSIRRAKAIVVYLVAQGLPSSSMRYKGYGFSRPLVPNDTPAHRAQNRRVEFYLLDRDWNSVY